MKFSARVTYGLRASILLAQRAGLGPVAGKELCAAESLPPAYLEQVMAALKRAGLVKTTRGALGGYVLTRDPAQITSEELLRALQGPLKLSECPGGASCCPDPTGCVVSELFAETEQAVSSVLSGVTLADLVARRELRRPSGETYHI